MALCAVAAVQLSRRSSASVANSSSASAGQGERPGDVLTDCGKTILPLDVSPNEVRFAPVVQGCCFGGERPRLLAAKLLQIFWPMAAGTGPWLFARTGGT